MALYARTLWWQIRGLLLAVLGVAAAYALSLPLDTAGVGFVWQALLGIAAFTQTVRTAGRHLFHMHPADAIEDAATALHAFAHTLGRICYFAIPVLAALTTHHPYR